MRKMMKMNGFWGEMGSGRRCLEEAVDKLIIRWL
jgi:hypothetical protein